MILRMGCNPSYLNDQQINLQEVKEAKIGDRLKVTEDVDFFYTVEVCETDYSTSEVPQDHNMISQPKKRKNDSEPLAKNVDEKENEKKSTNTSQHDESQQPTKRSKTEESSTSKEPPTEPSHQPSSTQNSWEEIDDGKLYVFTSKGVTASSKIAGYDVDGTIITTKSGRVFPKDCDDWQLAFNEVPGVIKEIVTQGFKVVFFTNQAGVSNGKVQIRDLKRKLENIVSKLNVPVQIFVSTGKGLYRKPVTGSWEVLTKQKNDGIPIELNESFYCGDAAGRPEKKEIKRKKDHSCADRLFALNVGIKFFTPEEHFQRKPAQDWIKPEFDPTNLKILPFTIPDFATLFKTEQEAIVMVGYPASGKSYFAKQYLETRGYVYINRDTLKTWQKCVAVLEDTLKQGKSAVIDNTNPDRESRKRYVDACKKHKVPVRCFLMLTSDKQSRHNNTFREIVDPSHAVISEMVFNGYKSKFQEPNLSEGFAQIVRVNFVPNFENPDDEKLYKSYLLDK